MKQVDPVAMLHCDYLIWLYIFYLHFTPCFCFVGSCVQLAGFFISQDQYLSRLIEPRPFAPFGELLHIHSTDEGGTQYEIYIQDMIMCKTGHTFKYKSSHSENDVRVYLLICLSWLLFILACVFVFF